MIVLQLAFCRRCLLRNIFHKLYQIFKYVVVVVCDTDVASDMLTPRNDSSEYEPEIQSNMLLQQSCNADQTVDESAVTYSSDDEDGDDTQLQQPTAMEPDAMPVSYGDAATNDGNESCNDDDGDNGAEGEELADSAQHMSQMPPKQPR
jgi:hypothetical protein